MKLNLLLLVIALNFSYVVCLAQADTVIFINGDRIIGEIKKLDKAVLTIETPYSKSDLTTEWEQVSYINTTSRYVIITSDGDRYTGRIHTDPNDVERIVIVKDNGHGINMPLINIVFLKSVAEGRWDRLDILLEGGYSLTKSNNVKQFSFRGNIAYTADRWMASLNANIINSTTQDSIRSDRRSYGGQLRYFIVRDVFLFSSVDLLESVEQDLDLRTNTVIGIGTAFIRNQDVILSLLGGLSLNNERYLTEGIEPKNSGEGYLGLEANLFGYDDLSMYSKLQTYPSFTDKNRIRLNFDFNIKYDLPLDFYISAGTTFNYDNQPQSGGEKSDYVVQSGIGWKF